jgi:hypothetical protein
MIMAEPTTFPEPVLKNFLWDSVFCKKKKGVRGVMRSDV